MAIEIDCKSVNELRSFKPLRSILEYYSCIYNCLPETGSAFGRVEREQSQRLSRVGYVHRRANVTTGGVA